MDYTTDFFNAISKGDLPEVNSILAKNPDLASARNKDGISAILFALYQQQRDIAKCLLAEKPELDIFDAAGTGDLDQLQSLLGNDSALANAQAADGARPLHLACFFSQTEAANLLLKHGAQTDIAVAAFGGVYPLHSAAASRSTDIVKILLEAGADPNTKQQAGWTALHSAVMHNNEEMTEVLLKHGASASLPNDEGISPQQMPEAKSNPNIVELLKAAR